MKFTDVTPEMVVRVHEIIRLEKPAHVQYYLRFAADEGDAQLREFFAIGLRSGIGIGDEIVACRSRRGLRRRPPAPAHAATQAAGAHRRRGRRGGHVARRI